MKEIVLNKPKETIHVSEDLKGLHIIASSCGPNENKWHPHGMIVKKDNNKYNVIRPDGQYQFKDFDSIRELIEKQSYSHWKFYAI